ncbi:Ig-like domain-containing protein [Clostridium saccharoperbutylacetonicum]|uniref:Ig-like domain-containing protein n=1 Tax=Clostridium saccharoperbutylacetonicum TaxID=36745 RepID=UPI0039E782DF
MKNYFKKFSIMFMMAFAIIGIGMIYGGNCANAATVGQQLTSPESGWQRFDDTNSNIFKNGTWYSVTGSRFSGGSIAYSDTNGATIKFIFYGTSFRIIDEKNTNRSNPILINIDGNSDTYNPNGSVQQNTIVYQKLNLQLGIHSVVISNGNSRIGLDAIDSDGYLLAPSISLDKSTLNLTIGDTQSVIATTTPAGAQVTWTSSDKSIATVDSNGDITGVKEGTCTITAATADGLIATCTVTVSPKGTEPSNPTTGDANLYIELVDGQIKQYTVSSDEVNKFTSWFENRDKDHSLTATYKFTKGTYKDYVVHDQIDWFEVR